MREAGRPALSTSLVLLALAALAAPMVRAGQPAQPKAAKPTKASSAAKGAPAAHPSASGFVRVNGDTLELKHAYAFVAPDAFDDKVAVDLVAVSPEPIAADALAGVETRKDVFKLVPAGAIVEVRGKSHTVFINHKGLGGKQLQTGGDMEVKTDGPERVAGTFKTFMPGDEDHFGYKTRWEITVDAPIVRKLPLGK